MVSPRYIRLALAFLVMAAIIGMAVAIFQKGSRPVPPEPVAQQLPRKIDAALYNARFTEVRSGKVVWVLVAERAEYDKSGEMAYLTGIRMVFSGNRSNGNTTLTAATGEYSLENKNVKLRGKVHVKTDSGANFESEALDYLASRSRFVTNEQVVFRQQRMALTAKGMELDVKEQKAHFNKAIDATVEGMLSR